MSQKSTTLVIPLLAIFWDWQNIRATEEQIRCLMMFAYANGNVVLEQAYADWGQENQKLANLLFNLLDCINVPSSKDQKNRADYKLIEHCRKRVLNNPNISTVILISADGDFTSLVNELKAKKKKVIVVARSEKQTSRKLRKFANEFYLLSQIEQRFSNLLLVA